MINKNQTTSETAIATNNLVEEFDFDKFERNNHFEPVKLNLPEYEENDDPSISSLFGDQNHNQINEFIYEKNFNKTSNIDKLISIFNNVNTKKLFNKKLIAGSVAAVTLVGLFTVGNNLYNFDSSFVADASPLVKIESQNILAKTKDIKAQIASGNLYNENYTVSYKIKENETIAQISKATNVPQEAIKMMNNISDDKELSTKDSIVIPTRESIVHKVSSKDTLSSIAQKYKVSVNDITEMNKGNLKNPNYLQLDQLLFIPLSASVNNSSESAKNASVREAKIKNNLKSDKTDNTAKKAQTDNKIAANNTSRENNIVHKLVAGENLEILAMKYKVPLSKILASNPKLTPNTILQINQQIIIPVNPLNRSGGRGERGTKIASRSLMSGVNKDGLRTSGRFVWPAQGEFSSPFGRRGGEFHKGIDVAAVVGTPIYSALQGEVIYTGWESGYGQTVEIRHSNGLVTRYAHCSRIFVHVGQSVLAGEHIAAIGMTGHVTGPHVHFEVLVNGVQVNPRNYL